MSGQSKILFMVVIAGAVAFFSLAAFFLWKMETPDPGGIEPNPGTAGVSAAVNPIARQGNPLPATPPEEDIAVETGADDTFEISDADMIAYMEDEFGNTIFHPHTQIKAIEKIMAYLMNKYPDDWESRIYDFLKAVFPDLADALFDRYQKLTSFNDWLRANRSQMMTLSPEDRGQALWDIRFQIFGDDALVIWENAVKNEIISNSLHSIAESEDTTVDEKLDMYMEGIRKAYEDKSERFISRRQTELMSKFLSVETVQNDLHTLPPEERQEKLVTLRKSMGLDEAALSRWDDLDRHRDRVWETGEGYMSERKKILSDFKGDEQAKKLSELQEKTFSTEELEMIRSEEAAGFFRYDHRRVYGKE